VTGRVADFYSVSGRYHSCNPNATVQLLNSYSKNRRVVTILDTDCKGGTGIGSVAMIEIVALMVGRIEQLYSGHAYDNPQPVKKGMMLQVGAPKALFRPGSSTVVLLFEPGRIRFAEDLVRNQAKASGEQPLHDLHLPWAKLDHAPGSGLPKGIVPRVSYPASSSRRIRGFRRGSFQLGKNFAQCGDQFVTRHMAFLELNPKLE
jgi:hypothetical protein